MNTLIDDYPNVNELLSICKAEKNLIHYKAIAIMWSGGKDSTIVLNLMYEIAKKNGWLRGENKKTFYVIFSNTLHEWNAIIEYVNKEELKVKYPEFVFFYTEAEKSFLKKGMPLFTKNCAEMIYRLQKHNFNFRTGELPKGAKCKSALNWWNSPTLSCELTPQARQWIINNWETMPKISQWCCEFCKKLPCRKAFKKLKCDMQVLGLRKAEGGARSRTDKQTTREESCFNPKKKTFNLIWRWRTVDCDDYILRKGIVLADPYTIYGLERTGCVGCPFTANCREEVRLCQKYEPENKSYLCFSKAYKIYDEIDEIGKMNY